MRTQRCRALALVALLAAPGVGMAQEQGGASAPATSPAAVAAAPDALSLGALVGYEWGDQVGGFQLRLDGELPFEQLSRDVKVSFVGSFGFTHSTYGISGLDLTVNRVKVVPAARFTVALDPQVSVFADAGLGLHYTSVAWNYGNLGKTSDSGIGLMARLAVGGGYRVSPRARIIGALAFDPTFGTYHESSVALLAGFMTQL
jgi:hypothetical protein